MVEQNAILCIVLTVVMQVVQELSRMDLAFFNRMTDI
jgi:hypothetical protein